MYGLVIERFALSISSVFYFNPLQRTSGPKREGESVFVSRSLYLIRDVLLVDYQTEHILIKPLVCHDEVAGVRSGAPTILNHPFLRLSICVEVNSHQGHGV